MLKTIALAAASAALMIGAAAVAQTTAQDQSAPAASSQPNTQSAPSADQNGANTAATDQSAQTGERG